jgi:hypothetical protein
MVWADLVTQMVGVMCPAASEATHNVDYNLISTKTPDQIAMMREAGKIPLKTGDLFGVDVSLKKEGWCGEWIVGDDTSAKARLLFSAVTADNSLAVYWEHVVAVTDTGCEVLDPREGEDVTFYDRRRG